MIRNKKSERRQFPRIEQRLPLKIAANGYDLATSTENVSCLGTHIVVEKYIPPFTRIMIKLTLPLGGNNKSSVECKGVVVRTDDEKDGGFNLAIFFNNIQDAQKHKISQYLNQFLPQSTCAC